MSQVSIEEAYSKWADELVRYATVLVGAHEAPDVVTDVFVSLLRADSPWNRADRPRAFLFGAVTKRSRSHHRGRLRRLARDGRWTNQTPVTTTDGERQTISLSPLTVQQRSFIYLAYWEDWTAAMIADHCHTSEGTVRKQLARARQKLREETS